jgi:hypothetical protein
LTASSQTIDRDEQAGAPAAYFAAALRAFDAAEQRRGCVEVPLAIAGRVIRLRFAGDTLLPAVMPALAHLETSPSPRGDPELAVALFDTESTNEPMPPPPWGPDDWGVKGEIRGFNDDRIRTVFEPGIDILQLFDAKRASALLWTATARTIPWWEVSFPLRTILHWWAAPSSLQPVHSGAVARGGAGALVVGASGAGKSTTTLACLEGGLGYLGDDYVMVDVDQPSVHSLYSTAKLEPGNLRRFPDLAPLVANTDHLDTQKAMVFLHDHHPDRLVPSAPLQAILLPRIAHTRRTTITAAPASAAMAGLAPTTVFQLPGFRREIAAKCGRLARSVPSYWLDVGEDLPGVAGAVGDLLDDLR